MARPRSTDNLSQFVANVVPARAARGMTQALVLGAAEAAVRTPIDTSTLLNSQYRAVSTSGGQVRGRVGYTAEYATIVHDPDHPQTFRRASAEKEFLTKGMEAAEPQMRRALAGSLKA